MPLTVTGRPVAAPPGVRPALVVDLDGSLVRTDTLLESMLAALDRPAALLAALLALRHGRARFKQAMAAIVDLDPALLPYNEELLAYLRAERQRGRALILATGTDRAVAQAVAAHLGLFDAVLASDGIVNRKGAAKLAAIRAALGNRPFAYVGNERADLAVWRGAAAAIIVDAGPWLTRAAAAVAPVERTFPPPVARAVALLRAMRPRQWLWGLLVFVPVVRAGGIGNFAAWLAALLLFIALGSTVSGVHLVRDLRRLPADRRHPERRRGVLAAGALPLQYAFIAAPLLLLAGLAAAAGAALLLIG